MTIEDNPGFNTKKEILHQPSVWLKTYELISKNAVNIQKFLNDVFSKDVDIILTGAGSSAFIGEAVRGVLLNRKGLITRPVSTTEIVTHPEHYLTSEKRTLLISFARSGNSPESIAAVDIVNKYCCESYHIIITCNSEGKLYKDSNDGNSLKVLLPEETNDISLAMTSSFTSMMLAFILIAKTDSLPEEKSSVDVLSGWISYLLDSYQDKIRELARIDFKRAVFLGSGPLVGTARESHLKLQELTDGHVICKFDSFLGFRHGPKAVINKDTLIVYLMSDDAHAQQYEYDLIRQVNGGNKGMAQVLISRKPVHIEGFYPDLEVSYSTNDKLLDIEYLCIAHVVFAQVLGYYKSLDLGLNPDQPSVSGAISRVVEGVIIYEYNV